MEAEMAYEAIPMAHEAGQELMKRTTPPENGLAHKNRVTPS